MTAQPALHLATDEDARRRPGGGVAPFPRPEPGENPVRDLCVRSADLDGYRRRQSERTLGIALWLTMVGAAVLSLVHVPAGDWFTAGSLFVAAGSSGLILLAQAGLGAPLAGGLLCFVFLGGVTVNMIDRLGIHDVGIVAYPVFVVFGGTLLGKRAVLPLTLACYLSVALIAALELSGRIHPEHPLVADDLAVFVVLLGAVAVLVWVSMDNLERNHDRIRRAEQKGQLAYERTLEAWSRALEYRDRETDGHSRRVTDLTVRLARELGIGEPELTRIRWGALLHDIGKLAIPDRILLKPGPLCEEERELIKLHPVYARDMLAEIPFLNTLDDIPYHHHERWDGSGYPQGLRGEEIPRAARIFAIVDVWEALSSKRPYREAWDRERILAFMRSGSGTAFDPAILEVFLERVAPQITSPSA